MKGTWGFRGGTVKRHGATSKASLACVVVCGCLLVAQRNAFTARGSAFTAGLPTGVYFSEHTAGQLIAPSKVEPSAVAMNKLATVSAVPSGLNCVVCCAFLAIAARALRPVRQHTARHVKQRVVLNFMSQAMQEQPRPAVVSSQAEPGWPRQLASAPALASASLVSLDSFVIGQSMSPGTAELELEAVWGSTAKRHRRAARRVGSVRHRRSGGRRSGRAALKACRRHVGAKLQQQRQFEVIAPSFEKSKLSCKMQAGLQILSRTRSAKGREFKTPSVSQGIAEVSGQKVQLAYFDVTIII